MISLHFSRSHLVNTKCPLLKFYVVLGCNRRVLVIRLHCNCIIAVYFFSRNICTERYWNVPYHVFCCMYTGKVERSIFNTCMCNIGRFHRNKERHDITRIFGFFALVHFIYGSVFKLQSEFFAHETTETCKNAWPKYSDWQFNTSFLWFYYMLSDFNSESFLHRHIHDSAFGVDNFLDWGSLNQAKKNIWTILLTAIVSYTDCSVMRKPNNVSWNRR